MHKYKVTYHNFPMDGTMPETINEIVEASGCSIEEGYFSFYDDDGNTKLALSGVIRVEMM